MKTETINDGGPAFPTKREYQTEFGPGYEQVEGMTLRDWFAGQALAGMCAHKDSETWKGEVVARDAYGYADYMISTRKGAKP